LFNSVAVDQFKLTSALFTIAANEVNSTGIGSLPITLMLSTAHHQSQAG